LHDLFVSAEAVTPGEFKTRGRGIQIEYGFVLTRFGRCLLAVTRRGICWLSFVDEAGETESLRELKSHWSGAQFAEHRQAAIGAARRIFPEVALRANNLPGLLLMGTNFQIKVWQAMLAIPSGALVSYESIGRIIGAPTASRAIGAAVGANAIAYLIPCHRVIRKTGLLGGYRWGATRKRAMLGWEAARVEA
jgi:AraC family transcriptional regulator of adaptative response/methylated-DNA-[protein]-cysteine methyltransferase